MTTSKIVAILLPVPIPIFLLPLPVAICPRKSILLRNKSAFTALAAAPSTTPAENVLHAGIIAQTTKQIIIKYRVADMALFIMLSIRILQNFLHHHNNGEDTNS